MGRGSTIVAAAAALSLFGIGSAAAQRPPRVDHAEQMQRLHRMQFAQNQPVPVRPVPDRWREMPPHERQRFQMNAERWQQMNAEQQRIMREREQMRLERMRREADAAMQQSGLQLEAERRRQFEMRYIEERRRVEESLRQELREKRQRELAPVMERLKKEFAQPQGQGTAAPKPKQSPK
jgi:hypothetical protein